MRRSLVPLYFLNLIQFNLKGGGEHQKETISPIDDCVVFKIEERKEGEIFSWVL
jgi:hypothetical protein